MTTKSRDWYENNKDDHNEKRRKRYQTDPVYREQVKKNARDRARERREASKGEDSIITRVLDGVEIQVFKHSEVAEMCGVSPRKMKADELKGRIPCMSFEGRNRVYTAQQRDLLVQYYSNAITVDQLSAMWS